MNKKIILSMLTIGAVLAMVTGATTALFSDTETSTGNTFSAGTIDISVNNLNPWSNVGHFTIADMKPSEVHYKEVTLKNVGSNPADIWKKIDITGYTDGLRPESETSGVNDNEIGTVIRYDISLNGQALIEEVDGYVMDEDSPGGYGHQLANTYHADKRYIYLGRLEPNATMVVKQSYHMDLSTGNWAQGDTMGFNVEFYAQQTSGGAPVPGTELPGHPREGTELDAIDIGNSGDMTDHNALGWWIVPTGLGNYGTPPYQYDGGSTIAVAWDNPCAEANRSATFDLDAGSGTANKVVVRHLAGITNDSFNVYVGATLVGTYTDTTSLSTETWHTTVFPLGVSFTGKKTIKLEPTAATAWGSCSTYGQGAFNWAKITD